LDKCSRSGPQGQIVAADVIAAIQSGLGSKTGGSGGASSGTGGNMDMEVQPVSGMRKVIASRLTESKSTIPHFYLCMDIKTAKIQSYVKGLNEMAKDKTDYKLSITDVLIKACALSCNKVPAVNSQWHGDHVKKFNRVDVSVAVATPTGLMTPIIFNADLKGLKEISNSLKDLAKKAKDGKLVPEEYQGGTFTISNLGAWGIKQFTAIINPPQSCILAVGTVQRPAGVESAEHDFMTVTLSCDHRIVDGSVGAEWLAHLKRVLENPALLNL
jgi:pyruvate dehydrogenase E2 component (dihydrolipoamide acetyltransferase)